MTRRENVEDKEAGELLLSYPQAYIHALAANYRGISPSHISHRSSPFSQILREVFQVGVVLLNKRAEERGRGFLFFGVLSAFSGTFYDKNFKALRLGNAPNTMHNLPPKYKMSSTISTMGFMAPQIP